MARSKPIRVVLVGGAPACGKSSVARHLANSLSCGTGSERHWSVVATDDLGAAARAVVSSTSDMHAICPPDHRTYFVSHSADELLQDALRSHRALWPAVESVIHNHATWAGPAVIEGWALLPNLVANLEQCCIAAVWLDVPEHVIEERVRAGPSLHAGAEDPALLVRRFARRSAKFGEWLASQTSALDLPFLRLSGAETPPQIGTAILRLIRGRE